MIFLFFFTLHRRWFFIKQVNDFTSKANISTEQHQAQKDTWIFRSVPSSLSSSTISGCGYDEIIMLIMIKLVEYFKLSNYTSNLDKDHHL